MCVRERNRNEAIKARTHGQGEVTRIPWARVTGAVCELGAGDSSAKLDTVADIDMFVSLPADRKGTHMSRFLEAINEYRDGLRPDRIIELCQALRTNLDAADSHVEITFPYFITKHAPASGLPGRVGPPSRAVRAARCATCSGGVAG